MGIDHVLNGMARRASSMDTLIAQPRWAKVSEYDHTRHLARVDYSYAGDTEAQISGWLPVNTGMTGSGWGMVCPVVPGQQVLVVPASGSMDEGIILTGGYSTSSLPPQVASAIGGSATPAVPGEFLMVGPDGTVLRFTAGGVFIKGDLHVDGDVFDKHGSLDRLRTNYDAHKHGDVMQGGGTTGLTDHMDPE